MAQTRVVVIGGGMVGSRFADDLLSRDHEARYTVTVIGAEPYHSYNRVLLSDVVAGRTEIASISLQQRPTPRLTTLRDVTVTRIDRIHRLVRTAEGQTHAYDVLVLATGATARIPAIPGLPIPGAPDGRLPRGVHVLRSLDDARAIVAESANARRAIVIGAGVLGIEVAAGLHRRNLLVTLVHGWDWPMERQLTDEAGRILLDRLEELGVRTVRQATARAITTRDSRLCSVRIRSREVAGADEIEVFDHEPDEWDERADLLVLACGTIPESTLAQAAGLPVDRGVVVDAQARSTADSTIFAIGDCAQPAGGATGLIAQGWQQSRQLATLLTTGVHAGVGAALETTTSAPVDVVRLKSDELDVVSMGVSGASRGSAGDARTLRLADPDSRRYLEVVVRNDRVVGATCVGGGQVATDLVAAYTRRTPVPADPAQLLVRPSSLMPAAAPDPVHMPDRTTVCSCNGVSKGEIVACWRDGAESVAQVAARTRATTGCGSCTSVVDGILEWLVRSDPPQPPDTGSRQPPDRQHPQPTTPALGRNIPATSQV